MRKSNYKGKICVFLCALLCVVSLSGCSTVMQSLADGTDAVLNGLTDGTDIVLNGLADGADQALGDLSEADDGQAKDSILEAFGKLVDDAGTAALTPQSKLQGHKENGADDYTGSYEATYSNLTGTEILFGGTTLKGLNTPVELLVITSNLRKKVNFVNDQIIIGEYDYKFKDNIAFDAVVAN